MPKLVCVVDDDDEVRAKIALDLRDRDFETIEVRDSRKVCDVLSAHPVDAIVVNMVMPHRDGVEVISDIRRDWPDLCIVAISAGGRVRPAVYLDIARNMGARACLEKPVVSDQLAAALC